MTSKTLTLSTPDLAAALGVTRGRISQLVDRGMPCERVRRPGQRGRVAMEFDPVAVAEWIAANLDGPITDAAVGLAKTARRPQGRKRGKAKSPKSPKPPKPPPADTPAPGSDAWHVALERARTAERDAHAKYMELLEAGDYGASAAMARNWLRIIGELRKLEVDAVKIELARKEVMPTEDVKRLYFESHGICAQSLRNLSKKLAPMIVGKKDPVEVGQIIEREVNDSMRSIGEMLNKLGKEINFGT